MGEAMANGKTERRRGRALWGAGIVAVALAAGLYLTPYGGFALHGLPVGAGVAAELACSGVFVSDRRWTMWCATTFCACRR